MPTVGGKVDLFLQVVEFINSCTPKGIAVGAVVASGVHGMQDGPVVPRRNGAAMPPPAHSHDGGSSICKKVF